VRRFPRYCTAAYAAQGECKVRRAGRWHCRSTIVGSLSRGAPSRERCRRGRAQVSFTVAYLPPPRSFVPQVTASAAKVVAPSPGNPYDETNHCIRPTLGGNLIPPADPAFQIRVLPGVPIAVGQGIQQALIARHVTSILHDGLGTHPLSYPAPIPIYLTAADFDSEQNTGVTARDCLAPTKEAIVIRTNLPKNTVQITGAHELYHAYSAPIGGTEVWWEEAAATWSTGKEGMEDVDYDVDLQFPDYALDTTSPPSYPYAMSRFVQFLDARRLIEGPMNSWPLQVGVTGGFANPGPTTALASQLSTRSTDLGAELAAFWGDRIRLHPLNGPQLKPTGANSQRIQVRPGTNTVDTSADPLHTKLIDFALSNQVR